MALTLDAGTLEGLRQQADARLRARGGVGVASLDADALTRRNRRSVRAGAPVTARLVDGTPHSLWVKKVNHAAPELLDDVDALVRRAHDRGDPTRIPRPWAYDPEAGLWLMDRVEGSRALPRFLLLAAGRRHRHLTDRVTQCARWLAGFHALTLEEQGTMAQTAAPILAAMHGGPYTAAEASHADAIVSAVADHPSPVARQHNDFTLRNILWGPRDHIAVVDWDALVHPAFPRVSDVWHDVGAFLVNVDSLTRYAPAVRWSLVDRLQAVFLDAYAEASGIDPVTARVGALLARLRLDLGLVERDLAAIYSGRRGAAFVLAHRRRLLSGHRPQ